MGLKIINILLVVNYVLCLIIVKKNIYRFIVILFVDMILWFINNCYFYDYNCYYVNKYYVWKMLLIRGFINIIIIGWYG